MKLNRRRFLAVTAAAIGAAAAPGAAAIPRQQWRGAGLGADVTLTVAGADERAARAWFAESARALRAIDQQFSLFQGSELSRLNTLGRLAQPSGDMLALLDLAGQVHAATGGAFDPTIQPVWLTRRTGGDEAAARALTGWGEVVITPQEIRLPRPGMALTLNGIAQGHAADRLAAIARRHGLGDLLIDAGEARAIGPSDWTARIEAPGGEIVRRLTLRDRALATSAAFGTRIGPDGTAAHIIGPRGQDPRWALVSISADRTAVADALSTAAVLMDAPAIKAALAYFPGARIEATLPL